MWAGFVGVFLRHATLETINATIFVCFRYCLTGLPICTGLQAVWDRWLCTPGTQRPTGATTLIATCASANNYRVSAQAQAAAVFSVDPARTLVAWSDP